ncbi:hypothetical protein Tco_0116379 [Tanacetum coccineum]
MLVTFRSRLGVMGGIENGISWVPILVTVPESGPSTTLKMTVPSTAEEKICKKNDVKARSLLLMALPNEHQLTFDQYVDAQSMFAAIKARFGGNEVTEKTQKALLKQQYENFNASSSESLDSIFNRLQKLVSRLAILGVVTPPEDLNVKFLRSLPSEWDTHVVVWMNKPDFDTMGLDDLYNNFKIVEQKVKRSTGAINDEKNLAFLTTSGASSINNINTVNPEVSTGTTKVNTASTETSTASFSDATVYAFLSTQPQGSQLVHEDLEQLHDDDLEEMDLKWNMALLSMREENVSTAINVHFARECRAPRSKDNRKWNQEEEIQANMALMAFSYSEVTNDKSCSKSCLQNYEALKKQYDDLLVKLDDTGFKASTTKEVYQFLGRENSKYKESKVLFSEEIALLKRSVGHKEYLMGLLRTELEKVKEEKEGFEFKIAKFEKSSKDLDDLLASQITDKSKKGFGYKVVPSPHPLILNSPTPLDVSYSGLEEFKQPEVDKDWKEKFFYPTNHVESVKEIEPKKVRKNNDASIIEDWVSDDEEQNESMTEPEKKTVIPTAAKIEKPVRRTVRYAEMYKSQRPRGNQRNWNGQKSNQLGCNFVFNNKTCFICGSFDHIQYSCPNQQRKRIVSGNNYNKKDNDYYSKTSHPSAHKHKAPRAVLMKTGLKSFNTARPVNTVRSVNTGRPFSTVRSTVNTVRARGFNASNSQLNDKGFVDSRCSRHMTGNIAHLSDFKDFDGGYVTFGGGAYGGKITGKGIQGVSESSTSSQQDQDNQDCIVMPIYKDASYFGDAAPRTVSDAQIQDKDALQDKNDATEKSHDDSSLKDNGTAVQQVNTARPEYNTGSIEVSTDVPEVNTATPENLVGPSHASEDTQVENQEVELGNIPQSYAVPTTPHTRIHKYHPIEHVIGEVQSSVQTRRMTTSYSEQGFLSAIYEGKTHQALHTCLFYLFPLSGRTKKSF